MRILHAFTPLLISERETRASSALVHEKKTEYEWIDSDPTQTDSAYRDISRG